MTTPNIPIQVLINFLKDLPANDLLITGKSSSKVLDLLRECWPHLKGSGEHNTYWDKIYRAENLHWKPPILHFELERHGATVNGSSRADVHYWEVDLDEGTAKIERRGHRQLEKMSPRMNVKAKAMEIANTIMRGLEHPALKWDNNYETVVLTISQIIPETIPQTTASRRKRFKDCLDSMLLEYGWVRKNHGNKIGFIKIHSE
ncbi:hypothetical protein GO003_012035 [Methylicorpusculum oleiharenae]|uniref:hypothetical protein n=1 Tax=Methylicorpusculum oleiharenae TaxID=1338687 RepID=UPI00135CAC6A|nr:hypothetical protein [Methylicorpusculum oleiharenae]MCD2451122.1 hypothetical protein [Methylicorpusculum oleiharenae]